MDGGRGVPILKPFSGWELFCKNGGHQKTGMGSGDLDSLAHVASWILNISCSGLHDVAMQEQFRV